MYFKAMFTTSLFALLTGSAIAQGQYGAVPSQSMAPDSNSQSSSIFPESSQSSTTQGYTNSKTPSMVPSSRVASSSATSTSSGLYSSTPSTLSSSMKPTSSTASSRAGMFGGLLDSKKLNLRAEPGAMDEITRMMPASEYSRPESQPAAYPTK
ncbi:hypothetical protein N7448_005403 [Penicillium atrosanguineum]|uniref:Uncharacterized protein n=1 Tax=Penicillium atrosanguineum TaxID=1132637 RepID=A0A9W9H3C6_9EURO|nr:calmodulin [Penicillium atrosanguineum]KAJ5126093.1 hypothetical protein N7526_008270 [Penicillium atrosanguineum]KAJ5136849.1 hypothetical protein N7448_005403 [Penicillium atrosanguineum]KAJ5293180.1 calmodulin [Penicillium atrosanguineum]KAJ5302784.1 hypothetical protein N7476_009583 [Penicillium atrosanguineum]